MSTNDDFDISEFDKELQALFAREEADSTDAPDEGDEEEAPEEPPSEGEAPDDDADGEGDGEGEPSEEHPVPSEGEPSDQIRVLDRDFSQQDAQALVEFYDWVRANPEKAVAIDAYLRGDANFSPIETEPQQPAIEEEVLDDLDPAVRQRLAQVDDLQRRLDALQEQQTRANEAQFQAAVQRGSDNFKDKYALTDEEVAELQVVAGRLNVVQNIAQQKGDYVAAVEETLELAYWQTEKFRDAAVSRYSAEQAEAEKRKRKASSISGGSGSVPRTPSSPSTKEGRRDAMVQAISQAMTTTQE